MTDNFELVGSIRSACVAISDHWEGSLNGPRVAGRVGGGSGSKDAPPPVSLDILDVRRDAHADLAHWARVVYDLVRNGEGGRISQRITTDEPNQPEALAAFIEHWADGLVHADPNEAELCASELAEHGRKLKQLALPDRRDWMPIGDCPVTVADAQGNSVTCGASLRAYPDRDDVHRFVKCPSCGTEDTLHWWMSQIVPEGSDRATATEVIAFVAMMGGLILHHDQIRKWASLGNVQRHGKDVKGRTLYSSAAVLAYARDRTKEEAA